MHTGRYEDAAASLVLEQDVQKRVRTDFVTRDWSRETCEYGQLVDARALQGFCAKRIVKETKEESLAVQYIFSK